MAVVVRSRRVVGPIVVVGVNVVLYTVPAGRTLIIRSIWCDNTSAVNGEVELFLNGVNPANSIFRAPVNSHVTLQVDNWLALSPGDTLRALSRSAAVVPNINVTIFGALLLGEPS